MSKGKREAAGGGGWQKTGDSFSESAPKAKKEPKTDKTPRTEGGKLPWQAWPVWKKALTIGGGCVLLLAVVAAVVWKTMVKPPDVSGNDRPGVLDINPNISVGTDGEIAPNVITGRKEDYYTFLLVGRDTAGGGNTDTMILVSYDVPNGQVNMMSLPRDTAVNVPWTIKKLNSVYNAKESSGGGLEGLKKHVAYLTGVLPDFYVVIEWKAVGELVDAVDGVEFDVPRNMNYDDPAQNLSIHLSKGMQTLTGKQAMSMLRYRNDNGYKAGYDDIGRMNTQRDFLKAMAKKVLQLGNITKITDFIKIFMENVKTDLSLTDLVWFATSAMSVDTDTMQSSTMPYIEVGYFHNGDYLLPDGEAIVPLVNEQFNPYNQEIRLSDLQILVRNSDGSCSVTSGELLATSWGKATSSGSSGTKGGGVTTTQPTGVTAEPVTSTGTTGTGTKTGATGTGSKTGTTGTGNKNGTGTSGSNQTQTTKPGTTSNTNASSGGGTNTGNSPSTTGPDDTTTAGPGDTAAAEPDGTTAAGPGGTEGDPNGEDNPAAQPEGSGDEPPLPGGTDEAPSVPEPGPEPEPEPQLPSETEPLTEGSDA